MQVPFVFLATSLLPTASGWFAFTYKYPYKSLLTRSVVFWTIPVNTQLEMYTCFEACFVTAPTKPYPTQNKETNCRIVVFTANATGLYCAAFGPLDTTWCDPTTGEYCITFPESELLSDYMFTVTNHDNCALWETLNGSYPGYVDDVDDV